MDSVYEVIGIPASCSAMSQDWVNSQVLKSRNVEWSGRWSWFRSKKDKEPKQNEGDFFSFLAALQTCIQQREKDGISFCGSTFDFPRRSKENVNRSYLIGLDYDTSNIMELSQWIQGYRLPGIASILHSSFSDGVSDAVKWRVWLPLSRPVTPDEFEVLILWLFDQTFLADESCKDPSRLFFGPRTNPESCREPWFFVRIGYALDPDCLDTVEDVVGKPAPYGVKELLREKQAREAQAKLEAQAELAKHQEKLSQYQGNDAYLFNYAQKALSSAITEVAGAKEGERNRTLNSCTYQVARLIPLGFLVESDIRNSMYNAGIAAGLSEEEVKQTVESAIRGGIKKPRSLDNVLPPSVKYDFQENKKEREGEVQERKREEPTPSAEPAEPADDGPDDDMAILLDAWEIERKSLLLEGADIEEKSRELVQFLVMMNNPPFLFSSGKEMVRVLYVPNPNLTAACTYLAEIEVLSPDLLQSFVNARIQFLQWKKHTKTYLDGNGKEIKDETEYEAVFDPPLKLFKNIANRRQWPFPFLEEIVRNPCFDHRGNLVITNGYNKGLRAWVDLSSFHGSIPVFPTKQEALQARDFLLNELMGDFVFADVGSKANALALGLLPFVRRMIDGVTPLHMVSAPLRGTGKSLLVDCWSIIATGDTAEAITEAKDDAEWEKRITASLRTSPTMLAIDNINRYIDSGALAKVLTSRVHNDRLLGFSEMITLRNNAVWVATANNPRMSDEIERRCIYIHLDPMVSRPEERGGFRHNPLKEWVREARQDLLCAALTCVQYWIKSGRPISKKRNLGSYEEWSYLMGGLLETLEVPGFLENRFTYRDRSNPEILEWELFCEYWWSAHQDQIVSTSDLQELASEQEILEGVRGDKKDHSQKIRLGKALKRYQDRVVGKYRIRIAEVDGKAKVNNWKLESVE